MKGKSQEKQITRSIVFVVLAILVLAIAILSGNGCRMIQQVETGMAREAGREIIRGILR